MLVPGRDGVVVLMLRFLGRFGLRGLDMSKLGRADEDRGGKMEEVDGLGGGSCAAGIMDSAPYVMLRAGGRI